MLDKKGLPAAIVVTGGQQFACIEGHCLFQQTLYCRGLARLLCLCQQFLKARNIAVDRYPRLPLENLAFDLKIVFQIRQQTTEFVKGLAQIGARFRFGGIGPKDEFLSEANFKHLPLSERCTCERRERG
jgi:hypothetical protein